MKHMEIMQHEIETATSVHIQGEILFIKAMFPENQEVEMYKIVKFKGTSDTDTIYIHNTMKEEDKVEFKKAIQKE